MLGSQKLKLKLSLLIVASFVTGNCAELRFFYFRRFILEGLTKAHKPQLCHHYVDEDGNLIDSPNEYPVDVWLSAYSVPQFAKQLGISIPTAWTWVYQGTVRSIKIGKRVMIPMSAVMDILEDSPSASKVGGNNA